MLAAAGLAGPTVELRDGREPAVIDTVPVGATRRPPRTRTRVPPGARATGGELVGTSAGLASSLSDGGGLVLPPRPGSPLDGRR